MQGPRYLSRALGTYPEPLVCIRGPQYISKALGTYPGSLIYIHLVPMEAIQYLCNLPSGTGSSHQPDGANIIPTVAGVIGRQQWTVDYSVL